jgi:hypothetical protein
MGIPKKGLKREDFKDLTAGSVAKVGSHSIIQVNFIEDGVNKLGFFKKLNSNDYPELLAKISVAASALHRAYMGKSCAEERLVFDKHEKLVGTLSIALEDFKPFNEASEKVPVNKNKKEQVIPSTQTLVEKNYTAAAFAYWFGDNDDSHPHNNGFVGDKAVIFDFDMFFYWFTVKMKGPRPVITPKTLINLSVRDWETFPIVQDSKAYHWPTYAHPGQETLPTVLPMQSSLIIHTNVLPKQYADPVQFQKLAGNVQAHDQKFAIALKALLTFQPEVIRARLVELFGEMPLNYTSLDCSAHYEKEFPALCNAETNNKPFVDFILNLYQQHYDNLYKVVVFYMGCEDNGHGVPLNATCANLYRTPSFFKNIETWMNDENKVVSVPFDLHQLTKRYSQIWRDAFAPTVNDLLRRCYKLINKALISASCNVQVEELQGKDSCDGTLKSAWELIGTIPDLSRDKIEPLISVCQESALRKEVLLLVDFTQQFYKYAESYYQKERDELTEEDNHKFRMELKSLQEKFDYDIRVALHHTSSNAPEYNLMAKLLSRFIEEVDFKTHLVTTDEEMKATMTSIVSMEVLPHTNSEVIEQYNNTLFLWAKSLKTEELTKYINDIIDTKYTPYSSLSLRYRAEPVKKYLASSDTESGDDRLAYILSSGNEPAGALNTLLILHLTPLMLKKHPIQSVCNAVRDKSFKKTLSQYTDAAVSYAKNNVRFLHLYSSAGIQSFYDTMYDWVKSLPAETFKLIVKSALNDYASKTWYASRNQEVLGYFKYKDQAKIFAFIILKGPDKSTLSEILFQKIIAGMKTDISKDIKKSQLAGNRLIMQYNHSEHGHIYADAKKYAVGPSQQPEILFKNASLTL